MRRATAALLGTVAGTALLVGAKYATPPPNGADRSAAGDTGTLSPPPSDAPPGDAQPSGPEASATTGPGSPAGTAPGAPAPGGSKTSAGGGGAAKSTAPGPGGGGGTTTAAVKTVSGNPTTVVSPGVGAVTVTIKVTNGAITAASATISQSNWPANDKAFPALNSLAVQYAKTDISKLKYSGATLTSNAYQASLKSAMSKAGI